VPGDNDWLFDGFSDPAYTQTPDQLFDVLMPRLTESELKVLLYVVRRTFGFKKQSDDISLKQMVEGIKTRDGRQLDSGTGLSRPSVTKGVRGLVAHGVLTAVRNSSQERGDEPTSYRLRFKGEPLETSLPRGSQDSYEGGGNNVSREGRKAVTPQETVDQHTDDNSSKGPEPVPMISAHERRMIESYLEDYARELNDQAPLASTLTRTLKLYANSGLELISFLNAMQEARSLTQKHSGGIRAERGDGSGRKAKMAYWFATLEDLLKRAA
jgi:hypothetical protein